MKKLIFTLILIPSFLFCQDFSFEVDYHEGTIEKTLLLENNMLFEISGTIETIYIFSSNSIAKEYLVTSDESLKPKKIFHIGETILYADAPSSVDYYINKSTSGAVGQIKSIDNISFTYAPDYSYNRYAGVVGKLSKVGNIKISYWTDGGYTESGKYRGKIKSLGDKQFKYEGWSSWGDKVGMVGKINAIGPLQIKYYDTDYDTGFKGKIKSIGAVQFSYFRDTYNNKKANIVGKFKQQTGHDSRLLIH